ncbi:MAG: TIGR02099 family protein [Idiomarina sp.]|nr:TIGR02099 family protein [Idiomarina sp.]
MTVRGALTFLVNKLWLALAVVLVTAAVLLSLTRLALPHLDGYRAQIESLISDRYGQEVSLGGLNAAWTSRGPALVLEELEVVAEEGSPVALRVGKVELALSLWSSLFSFQFVFEEFVLDQVKVDLYRTGNGTLPEQPLLEALENLLLQQLEHFQVRDSEVRVHTLNERTRLIAVDELRWLNRDGRRQATGRFSIPDVTANHLNFIAEFDSESERALTGSVFFEASRLDISPWIEQITTTARISRAEFNLRGWLDFQDGRFGEGQLHFEENYLEWQRSGESHQLITSPTTWSLRPNTSGWVLASEPMVVDIDGQDWPVSTVIWQYDAGVHVWNFEDVQIVDVGPVWSLFGSPGEEVRNWSEGLQPTGVLNQIKLRLSEARTWQFYIQADGLEWQPYLGIPGARGLSLEFWSESNQGRFLVNGQSVSLYSPTTYTSAQELLELNWEGYWERDDNGWAIRLPEARFALPEAKVIQQFRLSGGAGISPEVEWSIRGGTRGMRVFDALALLPLQLGEGLSEYLQDAVVEGLIDDLNMVWRGALADFPYRSGGGVFQAQAVLSDLRFQFQQDWLPLQAPEATIRYENEALSIQAANAKLGEVTVTQLTAQLPELLDQERWLFIDVAVQGHARAAHAVFAASPLADTVGTALAEVQADGELTGEFRLSIPFFPAADIRAVGHADFARQNISINPVNALLSDVTARLEFENASIRFESEAARWNTLPIDLALTGGMTEHGYGLTAEISGAWMMPLVQGAFPDLTALSAVSGEVAAAAEFELMLEGDGAFNYDWRMRTDLTAVTSNLPAPFGKQPGEMWFWDSRVKGDQQGFQFTSQVDDQFLLDAYLPLGSSTFESATLALGTAEHVVGEFTPGFHVKAQLEQLDVLALTPWFAREQAPEPVEPDAVEVARLPSLPALTSIDASVGRIELLGQQFEQVQLSARRDDNEWQGDLNADQTRMTFRHTGATDALWQINADFLELTTFQLADNENDESAQSEELRNEQSLTAIGEPRLYWLEQLPAFEFICRICRYDGGDFGRVTLGFDPTREGEQLRHLRMLKSGHRMNLDGGWRIQDGRVTSRLKGEFFSNNISALLAEWGTDSVVRDSDTRVDLDLNWQGYLSDFNRATLSGDVEFRLGAGYLRDVSDGGARLFSLLSLDSLVRKLTLDFRDIFARGMFFSSLRGDINIELGELTTENTRMNGAAGDLEVRGGTNLVTETLDYHLTFAPKVTSSLPVLLAFMVNPPSGIAALLLDRMLHDAQVITRLQYRVTGTMDEPVISEVRRDAREVDIPVEDLERIQEPDNVSGNDDAGEEGEHE